MVAIKYVLENMYCRYIIGAKKIKIKKKKKKKKLPMPTFLKALV